MPKKSSENTCYKRDFTLVSFDQQLFSDSSIHPMVNTTVKIHLSVYMKRTEIHTRVFGYTAVSKAYLLG